MKRKSNGLTDEQNDRRFELIHRYVYDDLTIAEYLEMEELQQIASDYINEHYPLPSTDALEAAVLAAEARAKEKQK